jgi:hypothetical protein
MLSRFHRKIGSLLGLLAILMATLAPTISHVLTASLDDAVLSGSLCSAQSAPGDASGSEDISHALTAHWQACGYCSLLFHTPVISGVQATFAVAVQAVQQPIETRFESVRRVEPLTPAQPRAPPVLS